MLLIILFLISTILLVINVEPFRTAGIFLSICYLPGLSFFVLSKKDKLLFEDIILAFPCSIGISSILILAMLFIGIHVVYIPIAIHVGISAAVIIYLITKNKYKSYSALEINKQEILFCFYALIFTLFLSIPFLFGPNRIAIAAHAFHHSLMVTQILNGIFPPENPGLGGTIIGYYWGFHALVAALTVKTNFQQIQIIFMLNMLSLYLIFCIAYSLAKAFNFSETYRYLLPIAFIGLMRIDAGMLLLMKLLTGSLSSIAQITASPVEPFDVMENWLSGLSWIDSRLFFMSKFYNVSGMPLAICLCLAYLLLLLLNLKGEYAENKIYYISIGVVISGCLINYPPLAIFPLLHAPLWACYILLSQRGNFKERLRGSFKILLPYITAILFVLPYLLIVIKSRDISSGGQGGVFSLDLYNQSIKNTVVFLIPLPLIIYGAWISFKKLSSSRESFFLFIGTGVCLFLAVFTRWPFNNSYKFNYMLAFFFSVHLLFALSRLLTLLSSRWSKRFIITVFVIFLTLSPLIIFASSIVSSFSTDYEYLFSGRHIIFVRDKKMNEAYSWIRDNTPPGAILMLSYIETKYPCCGMDSNYEQAAIAERNLYVIKDTDYTTSNPEYDMRIRYREKLFDNPADPDVVKYFSSLNHPVYLLIEKGLPEHFYFVEKRFNRFPDNPGKPFNLLFHNDKQRVYLIQFKTS